MNVEKELRKWLETNISSRKQNKSRDVQAVLLHYGFGDMAWPTLEQIGEQLSIGTRERVRQVLNSTFKSKATIDDFPILSSALEEINRNDFDAVSQVRAKLIRSGIISESTRIRGLLNLGSDLNAIGDYELVDHELSKLSRLEAEFDEKAFVGTKAAIKELSSAYKRAKTLPGLLGLASREALYDSIGSQAAEKIWRFMELSANVEFIEDGSEHWYIFENRDNTLVNNCEKIFSLSDEVETEKLAEALGNSLRRRSHKYEYPNASIILRWIEQSKWFEISGPTSRFLGHRAPLTEIESAVVAYLAGKGPVKYPPLKNHLLGLGFSKPNIDKAVTASPLVYVDKTGLRKTYTYTLISEAPLSGQQSVDSDHRYKAFRNRLKRLLASGGTEVLREQLARREQAVLREWLFGEKLTEKCAICGKEFSVNALVTAHKKQRSQCTGSEKTDPRIVFPLCLFGCDYLYETGVSKIINGQVVSVYEESCHTAEFLAAKAVHGNVIDEKWLRGKSSYFEEV